MLEVVRDPLGVAGKIIENTQLVEFERRKAIEFFKRLQRLVGARDIAERHARPCPGQRADKPVHSLLGKCVGKGGRAGLVAGLDPLDQQDELGHCIGRIEFELALGKRLSSIEPSDARVHQEGARDQLRRFRVGSQRVLEPPDGRLVIAHVLCVAARQVSAERRFDDGFGLIRSRRRLARTGGKTGKQKPRSTPNLANVDH